MSSIADAVRAMASAAGCPLEKLAAELGFSAADADQFVTTVEAARLLSCSKRTIDHWASKHYLNAYAVLGCRRYKKSEVLALAKVKK